MGIGLTACNVLCKVLGGYIKATSFKHRGSKFKFYIDVSLNKRRQTPQINNFNSIEFPDNYVQFINQPINVITDFNNLNQLSRIIKGNNHEVLYSKEDEYLGSIASEYVSDSLFDVNQ